MKNHYFIFGAAAGTVVALSLLVNLALGQSDDKPRDQVKHGPVCSREEAGSGLRCHARVEINEAGKPKVATVPTGYGPIQFHGAYTNATATPNHQIIAIVDAFDHPAILSDLATYSATFGIPSLPACTVPIAQSPTPCFQKVDQRGGTNYPSLNSGWALEIALDVEVAHAICQNCGLLLVEADSNTYTNLLAAVDRAIALGATVVSNSYGSGEFSSETSFDNHFNHPGVAITFSSGDNGFGPQYPAASPYVTAVGGTTLNLNSNNTYKNETAWSGSGSGCSAFETKPVWQTDPLCGNRTIADVSADADPATGAAVYNSVRFQGRKGWFKVGGTSLASPLIAGIYALASNLPIGSQGNSLPYLQGTTLNLHDIVSGSNGSCGGTYLCTATLSFDGPTGLGTPNGLGAF